MSTSEEINPADHEAQVAALAQSLGIDFATMSRARYTALSLRVRTSAEKRSDGKRVVKALGKRVLRLGQIPQAIKRANKEMCENCPSGKFFLVEGKHPACKACNCTSFLLGTKQGDNKEYCPLGHWDNRLVDLEAPQ